MLRKQLILIIAIFIIGCVEYQSPIKESTEIEFLKTPEFKLFLDLAVNPDFIDNSGAASRNQNGFLELSAQRVASRMIMRGIADDSEELIEKGVKAIEYGFEQQNEDGSFKNGLGLIATNPDALEANTFFLQAVGHSYLLLQQSRFSDKYLPRLGVLKPRISKALEFLKPYKETLYRKAVDAPNRLVFDALAFKLNGIVLYNKEYQQIGDQFIIENLRRQENGVFVEQGGYDSSYQAVSLLKLQQYWLYSKDEMIMDVVDKGIAWEKTRILDTGEVNVQGNSRIGGCKEKFLGKCKDIDYPSVALSFLYYAKINNDEESGIIAKKIIDYKS